ncbi:hypothetical protein NG796_18410 [Laspinema sp. A4]|uniref:hypothetical protein n=1 Tax=Laspinema sp. D2d TaxID=2953686 RepID=UPI0021BB5FBA|nr:hypothetical protein [Laspinema sp. D2d]MCT7985249.1 hypothetical protein [Laspinema sp. D2d]
MKRFIPTFFNLKLTYHNHHSSLEEAEGGIHGKIFYPMTRLRSPQRNLIFQHKTHRDTDAFLVAE